ncbi:MAG: tol-pal system protein YbgF [Thiomicrospira sp.]
MKQSHYFQALLIASMAVPSLVMAQTLDQRVERLERMANNPVLLQHAQRMNDQQREIQSLYDEIDRLKNQLRALEKTLSKQYREMDERLHQLKQQTAASVAPAASPRTETSAPVAESSSAARLTPEREAYDAAFALMREGRYADSAAAFKAFIGQYPKTSLTSNAYYWMGEAYLIQQQFASAQDAFAALVKLFPDSDKVEDALLRGGDSLVGLNRMDEAKAMYQDLIKRYPQGRAAQSAQSRLERFKTGP